MSADRGPIASLATLPPWLAHAVGPVVVALLVLALAVMAIGSDHARSREQARVDTRNVARLVEAQWSEQLHKIDLYLQLMALRHGGLSAPVDAGTRPPVVQPVEAVQAELEGVQIADAAGSVRVRVGAIAGLGEQVSTQRFFREAVAEPRGALVVSGPLAVDAGARRLMVFARAVRDPRGGLLGVVYGAVATSQLDSLFDGVALGSQGSAVLRTENLSLVHFHPMSGAPSETVPEALRRALAQAPREGSYEAPGVSDGHTRIHSYRKLRDQPFYVVVGRSTQASLAGWRANALVVGALAGVTMLLTLCLAFLQYRGSSRQLQALTNRFEAIVQNSSDSIVSKDLQGRITTWNPGAEQIFGYSAAEMCGQTAAVLLPPERSDEDTALIARVVGGERLQAHETQRLRRDGALLDVSMAVSPVLDARGRLAGVSVITRDISRHKAMENEIRAMAFHDPLTRLPNRRLLMDRLSQVQLTSSRQRSYFGVLYIDLDGFKRINDNFGHEAGDQLLIEIGRRLQSSVRQHDTVARLGGDEFVVLLGDLGSEEKSAADHVNTVADKILDAIERSFHLRGEMHRCSASIGIRLILGSQDSGEQVLIDADAAMYNVKRQRRALRSLAFE
jgi:diguanylate cyclase (GGDEF)-like protein/PAS domain S-box-containing protein